MNVACHDFDIGMKGISFQTLDLVNTVLSIIVNTWVDMGICGWKRG